MRHLTITPTFVAAGGLIVLSVANAGASQSQALNGKALKALVPGATVKLDAPLGGAIPISYKSDGTMRGRAGSMAFYLGASKDTGRWWIAKNKLCHRWNVWFERERTCLSLRRKGNRIYWQSDSGRTGTGRVTTSKTIVAAKPKAARVKTAKKSAVKLKPKSLPRSYAVANVASNTSKPAPAKPAASQPAKSPVKESARQRDSIGEWLAQSGQDKPASTTKSRASAVATKRVAKANPTNHAKRPVVSRHRVVNVANDDVLNIRQGPSRHHTIVGEIPPGAAGVKLRGACQGAWCPATYRKYSGWVHRYYLSAALSDPKPRVRRTTFRVVRVNRNDRLNIHSGPAMAAYVSATLSPRARGIRVVGRCRRNWCPVSHGRHSGWVHRYYLSPETALGQAN